MYVVTAELNPGHKGIAAAAAEDLLLLLLRQQQHLHGPAVQAVLTQVVAYLVYLTSLSLEMVPCPSAEVAPRPFPSAWW
jgi:hypothetical protein